MFDFLKSNKSLIIKGYKITDINRKKKYGIAADSLKMLKKKSCDKFKV